MFWFSEFRQVVGMLNAGQTIDEIGQMSKRNNVFSSKTPARSLQTFKTVRERTLSLDKQFYTLFGNSDVGTQKLIALVAVMNTDYLFFDFMNEVFRQKLIVGDDRLTDGDFSIFFKNKQVQSEKVATWTDETLNRLMRTYKAMLYESGLTDKSKDRKIVKPLVDSRLAQCLKNNGMEVFAQILAGER
jgi:hypothetical protein